MYSLFEFSIPYYSVMILVHARCDCRYSPKGLLMFFVTSNAQYIDCRPEDLRRPFAQFGRLKDIYLPRDYYTG
jgi:hypothetical protein